MKDCGAVFVVCHVISAIVPRLSRACTEYLLTSSQRELVDTQRTRFMAENVAPTSATTADATRGIPYYEKLKRDLRETLNKKRLLDKNLVSNRPSHGHRVGYRDMIMRKSFL